MFIREGKRVALGSPRQQTQKISEKLYGNSAVDNKRFFLVLSSSFIKAENLNFDWRQKRKFFVFAVLFIPRPRAVSWSGGLRGGFQLLEFLFRHFVCQT